MTPTSPPKDPHALSKRFFNTCCRGKCMSKLFVGLWKLSVRLYLLFFDCFGPNSILDSIKIPTYLSLENQAECRRFLAARRY